MGVYVLACGGVGGEAVHEDQREACAGSLSEGEDLLGHEIQEGLFAFDLERAFRAFQSHAGSQSPVEFDDDRPVQVWGLFHSGELFQVGEGVNATPTRSGSDSSGMRCSSIGSRLSG